MSIKKVDFSKFTQQVGSVGKTSSQDSAFLFMAKSMLPAIPTKIKWAIGIAAYLIVTGLVTNIYILIKLIF